MPLRPVRITCPGATAAAVATTLLVGAGAQFTAAPLGDGRWQIDAVVADAAAALLALRIGEPLVVEVVEEVAPAVVETPPAAEERAPAPTVPDNLIDVTSFRAKTLAAAKTVATRTARGFGAATYGDGRWTAEENAFARPAYRGKMPGAIVFGAHEDEGRWWCGWRPAT